MSTHEPRPRNRSVPGEKRAVAAESRYARWARRRRAACPTSADATSTPTSRAASPATDAERRVNDENPPEEPTGAAPYRPECPDCHGGFGLPHRLEPLSGQPELGGPGEHLAHVLGLVAPPERRLRDLDQHPVGVLRVDERLLPAGVLQVHL